MHTTTARLTRTAPRNRLTRAGRTRFALAAAAGLIAITAATATATGGVANLVTADPDNARVLTSRDHSARPCRLSTRDVANWGETSAHLPQACSDGK